MLIYRDTISEDHVFPRYEVALENWLLEVILKHNGIDYPGSFLGNDQAPALSEAGCPELQKLRNRTNLDD